MEITVLNRIHEGLMKQLRKHHKLLLVLFSLPFWFLLINYVRALVTIQLPQNAPDIILWGAEASKLTWYFVGMASERPPPRHAKSQQDDDRLIGTTSSDDEPPSGLAADETGVGPYKLRLPKGGGIAHTPTVQVSGKELKKFTFTTAASKNKSRGVMNVYFIGIPQNEVGSSLIESQLSGYSDEMAKDWKGFKSGKISRITINGIPFGRMVYSGVSAEGMATTGVAYVGRDESVLIWIDAQARDLAGNETQLKQLEESIRSFRK